LTRDQRDQLAEQDEEETSGFDAVREQLSFAREALDETDDLLDGLE
jgi:hypothetical protein